MTEQPNPATQSAPTPGATPHIIRRNSLRIDAARAKEEGRGYTVRPIVRRVIDPVTGKPVLDKSGAPVAVVSNQLVSERRQQTKALREAVPGLRMSGRQLKKIRRAIKQAQKEDVQLRELLAQVEEAKAARLAAADGLAADATPAGETPEATPSA